MQAVERALGVGNWRLCRQFVEAENGNRALAKALEACKAYNATLIITRLAWGTNREWERRYLGPNPILIQIWRAGIPFVALDRPEVNRHNVAALAAQAEEIEQQRYGVIVEHRESVRQYFVQIARGRTTSRMRRVEAGRQRWAARTRNLTDWKQQYRPLIDQIQASGISSLREIARELNLRGERTAWGGKWSQTQVHRLLKHTPAA